MAYINHCTAHVDHGSFSDSDKKTVLNHINNRISKAHNTWVNTNVILLTFGSAFVYYNKTGEVVSNCHKRPESEFNRQRLTVEGIISIYEPLLNSLIEQNRELNIIMIYPLTVRFLSTYNISKDITTMLSLDSYIDNLMMLTLCMFLPTKKKKR